MGSFSDAAEIARDAKKIVDQIKRVKEQAQENLERDAAELEQLRQTAAGLESLLRDLPTSAQRQEAEDFLRATLDLINAEMQDPDVSDDDLKMSSLLAKRGKLRATLGMLELRSVFDTSALLPAPEVASIVRNLAGAQAAVAERVRAAEYTRIGFMVADLVVKLGVAAAKAMA